MNSVSFSGKSRRHHRARRSLRLAALVFSVLLLGGTGFAPHEAQAGCMCAAEIYAKGEMTAQLIEDEFTAHKDFMTGVFYDQIILPTLTQMTEQLAAVAFTQTGMVGTFFDAKHQLETQLVLDKLYVKAIQDYQPSTALCRFGTATAGLASTQLRADINKTLFMERSLARQLGSEGTVAASASSDLNGRIETFQAVYCDPADNDGNLAGSASSFCGVSGGADPGRYNKDISFTRTVDSPLTLDINLTDSTTTADEADVIALANNLFGYELLSRPSIANLRDRASDYHAARAVVAKRTVAENSYYALAAEKSAGTGASAEHLKQIIEMLGYSNQSGASGGASQVSQLIGDNPSYYAQMELLTKKIYQDPKFIVSLIDKPANVERQKAAMQSFRLMQQRDFYNSLIRQEMVLSVMLEEMLYQRYKKAVESMNE